MWPRINAMTGQGYSIIRIRQLDAKFFEKAVIWAGKKQLRRIDSTFLFYAIQTLISAKA